MERLISGRIENFKQFSQFKSIKDFNNSIEMWMADHKSEFTKGELIGLKRLVRYSAKYFGVANAKLGTIVKAINEKLNGYGISRRTFQRMLKKASNLGILTIHKTTRGRGGDGHNVFIFNAFVIQKNEKLSHRIDRESRYWTSLDRSISEAETSYLLETGNKVIKRNTSAVQELSSLVLTKEFVSPSVPKEFTNLVGRFWNNAEAIEEFWKSVRIATKSCTYMDEVDKLEIAQEAFWTTIRAFKYEKIKVRPIAYFWGVLNRKIDAIEGEVYAELGSLNEVELTTEDGFWPLVDITV